jgi:hypothetical protein
MEQQKMTQNHSLKPVKKTNRQQTSVFVLFVSTLKSSSLDGKIVVCSVTLFAMQGPLFTNDISNGPFDPLRKMGGAFRVSCTSATIDTVAIADTGCMLLLDETLDTENTPYAENDQRKLNEYVCSELGFTFTWQITFCPALVHAIRKKKKKTRLKLYAEQTLGREVGTTEASATPWLTPTRSQPTLRCVQE